jgi:L-ribulokinase
VFVPNERDAEAYDALFEEYKAMHDHFGVATTTMRKLKAIRREAVVRRQAAAEGGA